MRLAGTGVFAAAVAAGGCVGYSTYPKVESMAPSSPNFIQVQPVIERSLEYVIEKYHPESGGAYAVNLPIGMSEESQDQIVAALGADARRLTPETADLPTYHIGRVWVRGPKAKVDVIRPVLELGPTPSDEPVYQGLTVWLDAGLNPWRVDFVQPWSIGVVGPPEPNYPQLEEAPGQSEPTKEELRAAPEAGAASQASGAGSDAEQ